MKSKELAMAALQKMPHLRDIPTKSTNGRGATAKEIAKRAELVSIIEGATRNQSYIMERNRLIPAAEAYTSERVKPSEKERWARIFLGRMDELHAELRAKKAGSRVR